jgi:hypothetical protein
MEQQVTVQISSIADSLRVVQDICRKMRNGELDIHKNLEEIEVILGKRIDELMKISQQMGYLQR